MKSVSVQCRDIRLSYGAHAVLRDVHLDIAPGEFFALLGPSGSGKSTLLRVIAGFNHHQHGQLLLDGQDVSGLGPWQRGVGLVFQNYALWPHMSIWDNVAFGLVERRLHRREIARRVAQVLDTVGLAALSKRRPGQLSGGQQQRVALARTLVTEPSVLLLDEPLSNLDRAMRVQMRQELLLLQRRLGLTTVFVTHDQEEAMATADRMAVLSQGEVRQVGSPSDLYDFPADPFVASFVGTMNLLGGTVRGQSGGDVLIDLDGVGLVNLPVQERLPSSGRVVLSARPHAFRLAPAASGADDELLWMAGVVESTEFLGETNRYQVRVGTLRLVVDQARHDARGTLYRGGSVGVGLERRRARVLPMGTA